MLTWLHYRAHTLLIITSSSFLSLPPLVKPVCISLVVVFSASLATKLPLELWRYTYREKRLISNQSQVAHPNCFFFLFFFFRFQSRSHLLKLSCLKCNYQAGNTCSQDLLHEWNSVLSRTWRNQASGAGKPVSQLTQFQATWQFRGIRIDLVCSLEMGFNLEAAQLSTWENSLSFQANQRASTS